MSAPDLAAWRAEVRAWLAATVPPRDPAAAQGPPDLAVFRNVSDEQERQLLDAVRAYRRARYDAGYGALTLPVEQGGAGLPASFAMAMAQEEAAVAVPPSTELISVTTGLVGPAVAMFGTAEQRRTHAERFLRTDLLACQLFSEPGAGSDLAALACRAVADGEEWVVDGQKVWTSGARHADHGLLLARTDPDVPKHRGITAFLLPMDSPGVDVRPIRQMSGGSSFNEVFLSGVRIPDALRIGGVGEGWRVATATLAFERTASGSGTRRKGGTVDDVLTVARATGAAADPVTRQALADLYVRTALRVATAQRVARAAAAGVSPGPGASIGKLLASDLLVRTGELAADLLGPQVTADTGVPGTFGWTEHLLGAPGYRLAGGTDQVQRTIIAERVLGLPAEPRVDRDRPWSASDRG
ncbi:acyl-CoA dehydrogenase [Modestobacter sp. I12A-02628]|uniref:Acyl-CoA dehydrogenase n=1 Tax=Goekera deserti TaxID=2497753 RepID=A0A7K3WG43_9ACTN|nr:acyl-CoA dehydrogenase family protein [Goekera deserti]MPQ96543.1 acyl-CoA dehydrogenase [Goekera deserti]NDI47144.1 acyl-CoA dehydrogenase [Goekera deserti]NEL55458.1 acyl-CoA dehydrogenase [Goekera deserti]